MSVQPIPRKAIEKWSIDAELGMMLSWHCQCHLNPRGLAQSDTFQRESTYQFVDARYFFLSRSECSVDELDLLDYAS